MCVCVCMGVHDCGFLYVGVFFVNMCIICISVLSILCLYLGVYVCIYIYIYIYIHLCVCVCGVGVCGCVCVGGGCTPIDCFSLLHETISSFRSMQAKCTVDVIV